MPINIPSSDPGDAVIEQKKLQRLGAATFVQGSREPAAAVFELGLEHVAVEDAAVDYWGGQLFVVVALVALDEIPASSWEEFVGPRHGTVPVLFSVYGTVDAVAVLEPVGWAAEGAEAEEEVGCHGWDWWLA